VEKIAIASSDGINIDQHFGQAEYFYIFEIDDDGGIEQKERREFSATGENRLENAAELLSDVSYVLCSQIGPHAVQTLAASNITGFAFPGNVNKALRNYVKRRGLVKNIKSSTDSSLAVCGVTCGSCSSGNCGAY
jgi:nitrogen fixation protein NifB